MNYKLNIMIYFNLKTMIEKQSWHMSSNTLDNLTFPEVH